MPSFLNVAILANKQAELLKVDRPGAAAKMQADQLLESCMRPKQKPIRKRERELKARKGRICSICTDDQFRYKARSQFRRQIRGKTPSGIKLLVNNKMICSDDEILHCLHGHLISRS